MSIDLDTIVANISSLPAYLKQLQTDTRDVILASTLASGQDPLEVLDIRANTLGVLYILAARAVIPGANPVRWNYIENFCFNCDPEQLRYAPDRVMIFGKNLPRLASQQSTASHALPSLLSLLTRYNPSPNSLTPLHSSYLLCVLTTRNLTHALPLLSKPITTLDPLSLSLMDYTDNLLFHYLGGIIYSSLKMWEESEDFFEICICAPGYVLSAIQVEALKKLKLVQLIKYGKVKPLPKYAMHTALNRALSKGSSSSASNISTFGSAFGSGGGGGSGGGSGGGGNGGGGGGSGGGVYQSLFDAFPNTKRLNDILKKDRQLFSQEKNLGLIHELIKSAPKWTIKKLTNTYVTLPLTEIAKTIGMQNDVIGVRELIVGMIERGEVSGRISFGSGDDDKEGTVTFEDEKRFTKKEDVDSLVQEIQEQMKVLEMLDRDVGKSKDYLVKAVKRESDWIAPNEDLMESLNPSGQVWAEEAMYA